MKVQDQIVFDDTIENTLDLIKTSNRLTRKIVAQLRLMQKQLISKLAQRDLTSLAKRDINKLLKQSQLIIDKYYEAIQKDIDLKKVAHVTALSTQSSLAAAFGGHLGASLPPATFFESIASSAFIQGAPAATWWSNQAFKTKFNYNRIVRQGMIQGTPNGSIIAQVRELMGLSRRQAAALVQTSTMSVANEARLRTFEANDDLIDGYIWRTALDGRVCKRCMARADCVWTAKDKKPVNHNLTFINPPLHFNDRCILSVKLKSFKELGLDLDMELPKSKRASDRGQIKATTFEAFLRRKGKKAQDEMLGPGRADLWRKGKITLQDLVGSSGKELRLSDLERKVKTRAS